MVASENFGIALFVGAVVVGLPTLIAASLLIAG
jgi:hypothetical protein